MLSLDIQRRHLVLPQLHILGVVDSILETLPSLKSGFGGEEKGSRRGKRKNYQARKQVSLPCYTAMTSHKPITFSRSSENLLFCVAIQDLITADIHNCSL